MCWLRIFEYIYHIGCAINLHSIMNSGLIPGGQNLSKIQTVFFTSVDPMNKEYKDLETVDLKAPRLAWYKQKKWKKHQNTVYWIDIRLAQKRGLKFYQTRSNATMLYNTLTAYCIPKAMKMETGEIIYEKVYASPQPPPKISSKDGHSESSQQTQPKITNPIVRTGRPVSTEPPSSSSAEEIDKRFLLGCESTNVRTGRPVDSCVPVSVERSDEGKDADENVDADQVRMGRPVGSEQSIDFFTQREEIDIDFRVSGLPHSVVKQAENFRVRELVKKIESHPHRQALQADLQQSNACNPFSEKSKKMIRDMGNVELFDLCQTIPKGALLRMPSWLESRNSLLHLWHLLRENESRRHLHQWRLDDLSIPNYVIKKGRHHGARHCKTEAQKEHFIAHNATKRCIKKNFKGIHHRFQKDLRYRDSQLKVGRTEEKCIEMDELAQKDFTNRPSTEEFER